MTTPSVSGQSAIQRVYTVKALTDIWTGDADGKGERLVTTGLLGSIRWWFEVLVRGMGGSACDPTRDGIRCPDHGKKRTEPGHHCVVCELFGCTGWARKFRFQVLDNNGNVKSGQIKKGETVKFAFTELRPIAKEEWALLDLTLRLIADYGAIGGRTVFKPSDEPNRQGKLHHKDFGLIKVREVEPAIPKCIENQLREHVKKPCWRSIDRDDFTWASLNNFWCVKGRYLARQNQKESSFNKLLGRKTDKSKKEEKGKRSIRWSDLLEDQNDKIAIWLAGRQQESKKVFSFKDPPRTFGFVKPDLIGFDQMEDKLKRIWQNAQFEKGPDILQSLFKTKEGSEL